MRLDAKQYAKAYRGYVRSCLNPGCGKIIPKGKLSFAHYRRKSYCSNACRIAVQRLMAVPY